MPPIRVLIVDDHRLFRRGLRKICETHGGFEVVGEAADGTEAVDLVKTLRPHIVLMDISMPNLDGIETTRTISDKYPASKVIILTMHQQEHYVLEAIRAGAWGYILKDIDENELIEAIRAVYRGEALINSNLAVKLISEFRRLSGLCPPEEKASELNDGEMAVLRLVACGEVNKDIATRLDISENTVANRLREIYAKLHVSNRTQAALEALRRGWAVLDVEE